MKYQIQVTKINGKVWRNNRCGKGFDLGKELYTVVERHFNSDDVEIIPYKEV